MLDSCWHKYLRTHSYCVSLNSVTLASPLPTSEPTHLNRLHLLLFLLEGCWHSTYVHSYAYIRTYAYIHTLTVSVEVITTASLLSFAAVLSCCKRWRAPVRVTRQPAMLSDVFTKQQLARLKEHKYSASGASIMEPPLQVYWRWLVTKLPLWLAPNLITFMGLLLNIATTAILMVLDPQAAGKVCCY